MKSSHVTQITFLSKGKQTNFNTYIALIKMNLLTDIDLEVPLKHN